MVRQWGVLCLACCAVLAQGQATEKKWLIEGIVSRSIYEFLGSEDLRHSRMIGLGYPTGIDLRWKIKGNRPESILMVYYHRSTSSGYSGEPPNATDAWGVMHLLRYYSRRRHGIAGFVELGNGMQFSDQRTLDLSSRWSFSPSFGVGLSISGPTHDLNIGVRLVHLSNLGFEGNNQGQNQLALTLGVRF